MKPLKRPAFAVRPKALLFAALPALSVLLASGCHHRRTALRPVLVNPTPVVTSNVAPCPSGDPGCVTIAPSPAFSEPGDFSTPSSPSFLPKDDDLQRQSIPDPEPRLEPAPGMDSGQSPPPLLGPSARRQTNRRSAVQPGRRSGVRDRVSMFVEQPNELLLPPKADRPWRYIVLHHSDSATGSYAQIDRDHRDRLGTQGCGYHLIVGNGSESPDGQIEVATRWLDQKAGAHCRDATVPDANDYGIGVCLIGDMDESAPTARQIEATRALVAYLQERYEIPDDRVVSHAAIAQTPTSCPGTLFPVDSVLSHRGFAAR